MCEEPEQLGALRLGRERSRGACWGKSRYTFGWLVEVPACHLVPGLSSGFGPMLIKLGLGLGLFLITMPAVVWSGYRLLQLVGVAS